MDTISACAMAKPLTLDHLRAYAVGRTLFAPTTLARAIPKLGFVQADPIRAPARAQDLTLRHRVKDYQAGDLDRAYPKLAVHEDMFVNYGFLPAETCALMHPRAGRHAWPARRALDADAIQSFVRAQGVVHPRLVDAHFQHGKTVNWFGGQSNATTKLLDEMHYRGLVRVAAREGGVRLFAAVDHAPRELSDEAAIDALADVVVRAYAPLPERSLRLLISRLQYAAPQWKANLRAAFERARLRLRSESVAGQSWYWPQGENPQNDKWSGFNDAESGVRLLAPFDPIVWDRHRFETLWNWAYRFEAYTPAAKRVRGYYALPLLWRGHVIGWANLSIVAGALKSDIGYVSGKAPRERAFKAALDAELGAMSRCLGLG